MVRKKKSVELEPEVVEAEQPVEALPMSQHPVRRVFRNSEVYVGSVWAPVVKKSVEPLQEKGAPAALPRPTGPTCSGCPSLQVKSRDKTFNCLHKGAHPIRGGKNQIPHKFAHGYLQRPAWCPFLK